MKNEDTFYRFRKTGNEVLQGIKNSGDFALGPDPSYPPLAYREWLKNSAPFRDNRDIFEKVKEDIPLEKINRPRLGISSHPWYYGLHRLLGNYEYTSLKEIPNEVRTSSHTHPVRLCGFTPNHLQRYLMPGEGIKYRGEGTYAMGEDKYYIQGATPILPDYWFSAVYLGVTETQKRVLDCLMRDFFVALVNGHVSAFADFMPISDIIISDTPLGKAAKEHFLRCVAYYCGGYDMTEEQLCFDDDGPAPLTEEQQKKIQPYMDKVAKRIETYADVIEMHSFLWKGIERTILSLAPKIWRVRYELENGVELTDEEWDDLMQNDTHLVHDYGYRMPEWNQTYLRDDAAERFMRLVLGEENRQELAFVAQTHWDQDGASDSGLMQTTDVELMCLAHRLFDAVARGEFTNFVTAVIFGIAGVYAGPIVECFIDSEREPERYKKYEMKLNEIHHEIRYHCLRGWLISNFDYEGYPKAVDIRREKDQSGAGMTGYLFADLPEKLDSWFSHISYPFTDEECDYTDGIHTENKLNRLIYGSDQYKDLNEFRFHSKDRVIYYGASALEYMIGCVPSQAFPYYNPQRDHSPLGYNKNIDYGRINIVEEAIPDRPAYLYTEEEVEGESIKGLLAMHEDWWSGSRRGFLRFLADNNLKGSYYSVDDFDYLRHRYYFGIRGDWYDERPRMKQID